MSLQSEIKSQHLHLYKHDKASIIISSGYDTLLTKLKNKAVVERTNTMTTIYLTVKN